jgi:hypothetical protein
MSCPAQGYPIPDYRYKHIFVNIPEPVGSSIPKFSSISNTLGNFDIEEKTDFNLNCPAQGSPAPSYRFVIYMLF